MKVRETVFMNKICVIAKNKQTYFVNRLIEEVGQSVELFDPWSDHEFPQADLYIARTTGIYHSDLDLMMMKSLKALYNPYEVLKRFRSKSSQFMWMEELDLPILPWISLKNVDAITAEKFTVLYPEVVVKPDIGQGGWGLEVLRRETLKSWMKKHDSDYLLQPFIKGALELRYFFMKGMKPIVLKRMAKTGIAANFKNAGQAEISELPAEYQNDLDKLISHSGAHYGAIDLLIDHGRLYILELNSVPGIQQLEQVSGQNIIHQFLSSIGNN
jgi:glutathione synthase/RimK-type ligase-like ATP-grasp enzyme